MIYKSNTSQSSISVDIGRELLKNSNIGEDGAISLKEVSISGEKGEGRFNFSEINSTEIRVKIAAKPIIFSKSDIESKPEIAALVDNENINGDLEAKTAFIFQAPGKKPVLIIPKKVLTSTKKLVVDAGRRNVIIEVNESDTLTDSWGDATKIGEGVLIDIKNAESVQLINMKNAKVSIDATEDVKLINVNMSNMEISGRAVFLTNGSKRNCIRTDASVETNYNNCFFSKDGVTPKNPVSRTIGQLAEYTGIPVQSIHEILIRAAGRNKIDKRFTPKSKIDNESIQENMMKSIQRIAPIFTPYKKRNYYMNHMETSLWSAAIDQLKLLEA